MVSFLKTRSKRPDEDGWGKLKIVLKSLKRTKHMQLWLRVDSLLVVNLWIYDSYDTHDNCRVHKEYMMVIGKEDVLILSLKHNLNLKRNVERI